MKKIIFTLILLFSTHSFAETVTVKTVSGKATFNGALLKSGDRISQGGSVELGADASVDLIYPGGHHLRLKKGAKVGINAKADDSPANLELIRGQVFAYFAKTKDAEKIKIKTRAVVAGVRGTKYLIEEDDKKGTYVCVCEGVVRVSSIEKHLEESVNVKAGQDLWTKLHDKSWNSSTNALAQPKDSPSMSEITSAEFKSMGVP